MEHSARPPFQLRGGSYTMIVLRLIEPKHPAFYKLLTEKISQAPGFFTDAPVVIAADRNVKYEAVVKVMDRLQAAGVPRVGLSVKTTGP